MNNSECVCSTRVMLITLQFDCLFSVKNRCESKECWPLCVLIPDGAECICPNRAEFLPGNTVHCDAGRAKFTAVISNTHQK